MNLAPKGDATARLRRVVAITRLLSLLVSPRRSIRRAALAPGVLACGHPFLLFEADRNRRTAHRGEQDDRDNRAEEGHEVTSFHRDALVRGPGSDLRDVEP